MCKQGVGLDAQVQVGTQGIDPDDLEDLQHVLAAHMTKREGHFSPGLTPNDVIAQASWKVISSALQTTLLHFLKSQYHAQVQICPYALAQKVLTCPKGGNTKAKRSHHSKHLM